MCEDIVTYNTSIRCKGILKRIIHFYFYKRKVIFRCVKFNFFSDKDCYAQIKRIIKINIYRGKEITGKGRREADCRPVSRLKYDSAHDSVRGRLDEQSNVKRARINVSMFVTEHACMHVPTFPSPAATCSSSLTLNRLAIIIRGLWNCINCVN